MKKAKEILWVAALDKDGSPYAACSVDSWREAVATAKLDITEGCYQSYVWPNRVDPEYGNQPDYSGDYLYKAEAK
jgi:hypothetical protein